MENDNSGIIMLFVATFVGVFLFFVIVSPSNLLAPEQSRQDYAQTIKDNAVAVHKASATDKTSDFFILTEDDALFYVDVTKTDDGFAHSETEVTEDKERLLGLYEQSVQQKVARDQQKQRSNDLALKGLTFYGMYHLFMK